MDILRRLDSAQYVRFYEVAGLVLAWFGTDIIRVIDVADGCEIDRFQFDGHCEIGEVDLMMDEYMQ